MQSDRHDERARERTFSSADFGDRFEVEAVAGTGGMGTVYRARDRSSGQTVALKVLHTSSGAHRFAREISVLRDLQHPRVVRYISHGDTTRGDPWLAMEWLDGEDLDAFLARGPMSVADAIAVGKSMAEALAAAHARGILHRDIKPQNIFLPARNVHRATLLDFGIARVDGDAAVTRTGNVIGTPAYMAPEQVRAERDLDARCDVYALGCVLYECLAGQPAFHGEHPVAVLAKILLEDPAPLPATRGIPPSLERLVQRAMARERSARPIDGAALLAQIEGLDLHRTNDTIEAVEPTSALGTRGRRTISILLTASTRDDSETLAADAHHASESAARRETEALGCTLFALANGSWLVTTTTGGASPVDDATCIARAALALHRIAPELRAAVCTGRAEVDGALPSGQVIDRAAALLRTETAPAIVVDPATAEILRDRFEFGADPQAPILLRERGALDDEPTVGGRAPLFAGRETDLAALGAILAQSFDEPVARVALVTAPAGVGKSRLVRETVRRARAGNAGMTVLVGRCEPLASDAPFALAGNVLRDAAGVTGDGAASERGTQLRAHLARVIGGERAGVASQLLVSIAGFATPDDGANDIVRMARSEPALMADMVREAWQLWLAGMLDDGPVLLVLEDLHWADAPSVRIIDAAVKALADRPLLVLATARPEVHERFPNGPFASQASSELRLGALTRKASERFARAVLGASASTETIDAIVARAEGHPFFLEELLRASMTGLTTLPDTVLGMLEIRLETLGVAGKRLARAGSVFGESFRADGVAALVGSDVPTVVAQLAALVATEIIAPSARAASASEREYVFRHALMRDAAYATLTEADRRLAHRLAAAWIENDPTAEPLVIARHFELGGSVARASEWYARAAQRALERNDLPRAADHVREALRVTADVPTRGPLYLLLAEVAYWRGEHGPALEHAQIALDALSAGSGDWFHALGIAIGSAGQRGDNDTVESLLTKAMAQDDRDDARDAQVLALARGISQLAFAHRARIATQALARMDAVASRADRMHPLSEAWMHRARGEFALIVHSRVEAAIRGFDETIRIYDAAGAWRNAMLAGLMLSSMLSIVGRHEEALGLTERALEKAERLGIPFLVYFATDSLGLVHSGAGRRDEAIRALARCLDVSVGSVRIDIVVGVVLAMELADAGRLAEAETRARAAVALAAPRVLHGFALGSLAYVLAARGASDEAVRAGREAMSCTEPLDSFDILDVVPSLGLAVALDSAGERAEAIEVVSRSLERVRRFVAAIENPAHLAGFWRTHNARTQLVSIARDWGLPLDLPGRP